MCLQAHILSSHSLFTDFMVIALAPIHHVHSLLPFGRALSSGTGSGATFHSNRFSRQVSSSSGLKSTIADTVRSATAKSGSATNRGGSISVSGYSIVVPDNLLVEFPAAFVPFAEFAEAGASKRAGPNEVSVTGNIVNNVIIAAQFSVAQLDLAFSSGTIEGLSSDGAIKIKNGPTLHINDPRARYSAGYTNLPFFTADDENASITSFSGFPMCVPRGAGDAKCPDSNRPAGSSSL